MPKLSRTQVAEGRHFLDESDVVHAFDPRGESFTKTPLRGLAVCGGFAADGVTLVDDPITCMACITGVNVTPLIVCLHDQAPEDYRDHVIHAPMRALFGFKTLGAYGNLEPLHFTQWGIPSLAAFVSIWTPEWRGLHVFAMPKPFTCYPGDSMDFETGQLVMYGQGVRPVRG